MGFDKVMNLGSRKINLIWDALSMVEVFVGTSFSAVKDKFAQWSKTYIILLAFSPDWSEQFDQIEQKRSDINTWVSTHGNSSHEARR